ENPEALAVEFMERMPGWLLGVHYDRSLRFFAAGDMEAARLHWNILQKAVPLAELAGGRFLEDCRARFAMHFLGEKPIKDTTDEQQRFLETAERLLALDPENQMARRGAIQGYVYYLGQGMEDIGVRTRKKGKKPSPLDLPMRKGSLLKTKRRLRTASNKLKRHLRRAMSDGGSLPAAETARHAISLANYYAYTERVPEAWRLARRAKVLAPDDGDVTNFFAWIKKLKRRMRR
ncbi:MAG: hypothetical protein KKA60_02995, partial [Proteobacteria bacterium]|nr:hypothetical protein [Pseudomonadota bacterium]